MQLAVQTTTINARVRLSQPQAVFHALLWLTVGANAVFAVTALPSTRSWRLLADTALIATSVNVGLAVLTRQQYVVNALYRLATGAPRRWSLPWRLRLAEVYQYGGVHVGAAIAATAWFLFFAVGTAVHPGPYRLPVRMATELIALDLIIIVACSAPAVRRRHHDLYEAVHRYGGWAALGLFAVLTVLLAAEDPRGLATGLAHTPGAWILVLAAVSILIPWLQLRRLAVTAHVPSSHAAVLHLPDRRRARAGTFVRLAHRRLGQSHAFAAIPDPDGGYRVVVSRAGDWTGKLIESPPSRLWVRGGPVDGVASVARLFHRVVWIATGSGIAPCLPHLLASDVTNSAQLAGAESAGNSAQLAGAESAGKSQLVWVTRNPLRTYGPQLLAEIQAAAPDARIWDTDADGKPDLADLAADAYRRTGAEAVICISNQDTTGRLVGELRRRGIPAYGPIWDS